MSNPALGCSFIFCYYPGAAEERIDVDQRWITEVGYCQESIYHPDVDPKNYGNEHGHTIRALVGGGCYSTMHIYGSRHISVDRMPAVKDNNFTIRGCKHSNHIILGLIGVENINGLEE